MEEWKEYKLGEVCTISSSKRIFASEYQKNGIPFYRGKEIIEKQNGRKISNELFISEERYNEIKCKYGAPKEGDMLLSSVGTLGVPYIIQDETFYFKDGNLTWFYEYKGINNYFLYYWFLSPEARFLVDTKAIGSTQKALTIDTLKKFDIFLPPIDIQDKIVSILKSLDDKIEMNRRINDNLEQQAQALFKSWFVDFEPFKDGEFVESELGIIPKGWKAGSLEDITTQKAERVGDRVDMKVLSPVTSGQLMLSEEYFTKQVFSESIAKYKVVEIGDFAYNPARVNIGSLGRNNYDFNGCVSPVYVVFSCKDGYAHLFDLYRKTEKFKSEVNLRAIGGVRQSLNCKDFAFIQCIIPPLYVVEEFNAIYGHILVMQKYIGEENDRLASLRDTLLPRLMSGELKVEDVTL